jgi:hypothetical protein
MWVHKPSNATNKTQANDNSMYATEKQRIESIDIDDLTFKDLYKLPFRLCKYSGWVRDANSNFIFQFEISDKEVQQKIIDFLNGDIESINRYKFTTDNGLISLHLENKAIDFILIRGWGNLTGTGAYNLDAKYAAKIQDTLAAWLVDKLNKANNDVQ